MFVSSLSLYHFKNYRSAEFEFHKPVVCISGPNGSGKTNLLDALYFLCFTRSYLVQGDGYCVSFQERGMRIQARVNEPQEAVILCILRENGKKEFSLGGQNYTRLSGHIGKFPAVFIAPDDIKIILEGSEERRRYIDQLISQLDPTYLSHLVSYNKILQQRNALLKQTDETLSPNSSLLDIYDEGLVKHADYVFRMRKEYCLLLIEKVYEIYRDLSGDADRVEIHYQSQLQVATLDELLRNNRQKDILSRRSNYGIHKDDLFFSLAGMPLRQTASQGQRKSFLFGLKLAQYEILKQEGTHTPLLLLDDIFEKLDEVRSRQLISYISEQDTQVFVTDTHPDRLRAAFAGQEDKVQWLHL